MKRILCVDGGGMRGFIPAAMLAELERRTGKQCYQMFDLGYGSSIGGIIVLLLARGVPANEIVEFFIKSGPVIFKKHFWRVFGLIARYPAHSIEKVLFDNFGDTVIGHAAFPVGITCFDTRANKPYFFKSFDGTRNYKMRDAARGTSAAQFFFPPKRKYGCTFRDGGNVANNPSLCAYADAAEMWNKTTPITVLSLGCGASPVNRPSWFSSLPLIEAILTTLDTYDAASEDVDYQMRKFIEDNYIRIQPELTAPVSLADASKNGLAKLNAIALNSIRRNSDKLDQFIATL